MKRVIASCFLLLVVFIACKDQQEEARKDFASGVSAFYKNQHQVAKDLFTRCIESNYNVSEACFFRGSARFNLKDYQGAIEDMTLSIKADSLNAEAFSTRGDILTILGKKEEGCKDWRKAMELGKPNMGDKVKYCK